MTGLPHDDPFQSQSLCRFASNLPARVRHCLKIFAICPQQMQPHLVWGSDRWAGCSHGRVWSMTGLMLHAGKKYALKDAKEAVKASLETARGGKILLEG